MTPLLSVEGVTKRFGGLQALTQVTFDLPEGQIMGLIGPNGAGKTTLFNCINGVYAPEVGRVRFIGEDVTASKTYAMAKRGLARTHQIVQPLEELTVRENVIAGACFGRENHSLSSAHDIAEEVMEFVRLDGRADQLAASLNIAQKKRLEMARALAARPYLLLLDEVLAGLNPSEIGAMVDIVKKIRDRGITIIMIEHVMKAVMNVSDRMIVLDYGQQIAEGTPEEIANNPQVIEAYLGDPELAKKLMGEE
ncbi:MAG: ABC transporter ATP-binding protein [Anaerolineae bacterium]|jgi:branched-chain amino acid transport system ATP-binding protein|nr:ABC transporter ATP-binding protein [Anaerolineae bacterium]MBT4310941.1 ABC transporter ATP-binding protein [Anaerolineae bacterium]MBT4460199.1 ABC transporter ATP-binding protein [Anaerolineae bacterium]MBT6059907.1 ABC transporter ATP-binding protein [Anaerolineae bacterium]MBT6323257.1 ABC transporter ATP-binding protein [Anaerolineae bacterium]